MKRTCSLSDLVDYDIKGTNIIIPVTEESTFLFVKGIPEWFTIASLDGTFIDKPNAFHAIHEFDNNEEMYRNLFSDIIEKLFDEILDKDYQHGCKYEMFKRQYIRVYDEFDESKFIKWGLSVYGKDVFSEYVNDEIDQELIDKSHKERQELLNVKAKLEDLLAKVNKQLNQ